MKGRNESRKKIKEIKDESEGKEMKKGRILRMKIKGSKGGRKSLEGN